MIMVDPVVIHISTAMRTLRNSGNVDLACIARRGKRQF